MEIEEFFILVTAALVGIKLFFVGNIDDDEVQGLKKKKKNNTHKITKKNLHKTLPWGGVREVIVYVMGKVKNTKRTDGHFSGHFIFPKKFYFRPQIDFVFLKKVFLQNFVTIFFQKINCPFSKTERFSSLAPIWARWNHSSAHNS